MFDIVANDRSWESARREARQALSDVQQCAYCRRFGDASNGPDGSLWTIDHVLPQRHGGTHNLNNLVKCCRLCNSSKGASLHPKWIPAPDTPTASGRCYDSSEWDQTFLRLQREGRQDEWLSEKIDELTAECERLKLLLQIKVGRLDEQLRKADERIGELMLCLMRNGVVYE